MQPVKWILTGSMRGQYKTLNLEKFPEFRVFSGFFWKALENNTLILLYRIEKPATLENKKDGTAKIVFSNSLDFNILTFIQIFSIFVLSFVLN